MRHPLLVVFLGIGLLGGCRARDPDAPSITPDERTVQLAASDDLDCFEGEIRVTEVAYRHFVAEGCGKQQSYRISCTSSRQNPHEHCSAQPEEALEEESGLEDEPTPAVEGEDDDELETEDED